MQTNCENQQKSANSLSDNQNDYNDNRTTSVKPTGNDYHVLIGDNCLTASTSQHSLCRSHTSSLESSTSSEYHKNYRNYISSPHLSLLLLFLSMYVLLMFFGASVLSIIEQKPEFEKRDQLLRKRQTFLAEHPCVDAESLDSFIEVVIKSYEEGISLHKLNQINKMNKVNNINNINNINMLKASSEKTAQPNSISPTSHYYINTQLKAVKEKKYSKFDPKIKTKEKTIENKDSMKSAEDSEDSEVIAIHIPTEYSNWEFTSSLLFVASVGTTIGYGHVKPTTQEGRLFCMLFACVAIPFTLLFISIIVTLLKNGPIKLFEKWLIRIISSHFRNTPDFYIRMLHIFFVTLILLLLILIFPALFFYNLEKGWTFLDGIYYCFISLTTVGLGDLVAGTGDIAQYVWIGFYRVCVIVYLYVGLSLIMLWMTLVVRIPQLNLKPFLLTEKEEMDEQSRILEYNKEQKTSSYGTQPFAQK